jgi:superfamily I DNA and/or RNA helicase
VNTVDAFQGREKDIIMINCVRSNSSASLKGSLGFLVDERRMNVAITRAKHFLFIIGNSLTLGKNPAWAGLTKECQSNRNGMLKFPNSHAYTLAALNEQFSHHDVGTKRLDREYEGTN